MSDVFISYSRKDNREFAMQVKAILEANGHKVWIDLDDMAKASDFLKQIYEAIENTTDFLVIISRLSLTSEYCNLEIQRARALNKRIIPIIRERVEGDTLKIVKGTWVDLPFAALAQENWTALGKLDWIFADADALIPAAHATLLKTLPEDLAHRKIHQRLQLRLTEWQESGRNATLKLRDVELAGYEKWRDEAERDGKQPALTEEQRAFIAESRRAAEADAARRAQEIAAFEAAKQEAETQQRLALKRQREARRTFIAGVIGFLVLALLAYVGVNAARQDTAAQTQVAEANAGVNTAQAQVQAANATLTPIPVTLTAVAQTVAETEAQRRMTESQRLAARAQIELEGTKPNAEIAALLGIRALRSAESPEAISGLHKANEGLYSTGLLSGHTNWVLGALALDDGRFLSWSYDGTLRLWGADGTPGPVLNGHTIPVFGALALDDGRFLSWSVDGTLRLWGTDGSLGPVLSGHTSVVQEVLALADGRFLSWGDDRTLRLWEADGTPGPVLQGHTADVWGALQLRDGRILSWSGDGTLRLWYPHGADLITHVCTRVIRDLTAEERTRFGIRDTEPTCLQFATAENPLRTPFPPTSTPLATRVP
jgi:hypothetical protein